MKRCQPCKLNYPDHIEECTKCDLRLMYLSDGCKEIHEAGLKVQQRVQQFCNIGQSYSKEGIIIGVYYVPKYTVRYADGEVVSNYSESELSLIA